jgi:formylglycine-generating enzyme required for sulfatase activity
LNKFMKKKLFRVIVGVLIGTTLIGCSNIKNAKAENQVKPDKPPIGEGKLLNGDISDSPSLQSETKGTIQEESIPTNIFEDNKPITEKTIDEKLVLIPANPDFAFATDLKNKADGGESSPITSDYYLDKYLTTNAEYKEFLDDTGSKSYPSYWKDGTYPDGKANHPVLDVSYYDAEKYCEWLETQYPNWDFRLPTEAEYENASVGPNHYKYPWGNDAEVTYKDGVLTSRFNYNGIVASYCLKNYGANLVTYNNKNSTEYNQQVRLDSMVKISASGGVSGWVDHSNYTEFIYTDLFSVISKSGGYTSPVNEFEDGKSYYGCYDMAGNAYSWTSSKIVAVNGAENGQTVNAVRGGSWYATIGSGKSTYRGEGRNPSGGYATVDFRIAATKK